MGFHKQGVKARPRNQTQKMVNINYPTADADNKIFLQNLGDITITNIQGDDLLIGITVSSTVGVYETTNVYTKDKEGKITIHDLKEIVKCYMPRIEPVAVPGLSVCNLPAVSLSVWIPKQGSPSTITLNYKVLYSNGKVNGLPSQFNLNFTQVRKHSVLHDQLNIVALNKMMTHKVAIAYKDIYGIPRYVEKNIVGPLVDSDVLLLAFNAKSIMDLVLPAGHGAKIKDLLYVDIYSLDDGGIITDKMKYEYENGTNYDVTFVFSNFFGLPETMHCKGQDKEIVELDASFGFIGGEYTSYNDECITHHEINTGHLDKPGFATIKDLLRSRWQYVIENDNLKKVVIDAVTAERTHANGSVQNCSFRYRVAEKYPEVFSANNDRIDIRVFDNSFDRSFE